MAGSKSDARSVEAWALAGGQHGVVTRRDLLALGFSTMAIERRVAKERLHPVTRGVYAVGWPRLTRERRWMAATLERTVNEADKHDLIDPEALRAALDRYTGDPGVRRLRALLDRHAFRLSDSDLEILFRPIARRA